MKLIRFLLLFAVLIGMQACVTTTVRRGDSRTHFAIHLPINLQEQSTPLSDGTGENQYLLGETASSRIVSASRNQGVRVVDAPACPPGCDLVASIGLPSAGVRRSWNDVASANVTLTASCYDSLKRNVGNVTVQGEGQFDPYAPARYDLPFLTISYKDVNGQHRGQSSQIALGIALNDAIDKMFRRLGETSFRKEVLTTDTGSLSLSQIVHRGRQFFDANEPSRALLYYQRAIERDPTYQPAYAHAGLASMKLGRKDEARRYFRGAVDLDAGSEFGRQSAEWLIKLDEDARSEAMEKAKRR